MTLSAPDPAILSENVKLIAKAAGFDDCKIAAVTGPAPHADEWMEWVKAGMHGEMAWLARDPARRANPADVLPGCRSVVVVALNYFAEKPALPPAQAGAQGRFARYAWGLDYHEVMDPMLRDLSAHLEEQGGTQKLYVDTGPVLERDWAAAAGLGWNGKSTLQIHRKLGTWFFLGEILTTLALVPDAPAGAHCGSCTRCIDACPTAAITRPHHVDARRCISYLTIENRGPIPIEFRRAVGDRIYGCDECLDVCPWNRFAGEARVTAFAAREYVHRWRLRDFLRLGDEQFRRLFAGTAIKRIKLPAFLRNVCVALGNSGCPEDLPELHRWADGSDPLVSEHARWAIEEIGLRYENFNASHC